MDSRIELTSECKWDHHSADFSEIEAKHDLGWMERRVHISTSHHQVPAFDPLVEIVLADRNNLVDRLVASVSAELPSLAPLRTTEAVVRGDTRSELTSEQVARRWHTI